MLLMDCPHHFKKTIYTQSAIRRVVSGQTSDLAMDYGGQKTAQYGKYPPGNGVEKL